MAEFLGSDLPDPAARQEVRLFRGFALLRLGRVSEAKRIADRIWSESNELASPNSYRFKGTLGRLFEELGRLDEAKTVYNEAISECRSSGNVFALNVALTYLGDLELELGNPTISLGHHFLALKSRRDLNQNLGIATSLRGIGRALLQEEKAEEAILSLRESTQRFRDDNALSGHASSQLLLAQAEFESGDRLLAERLAQNSIEALRRMSIPTRLTIGPWGQRILQQGEDLLRQIQSSHR